MAGAATPSGAGSCEHAPAQSPSCGIRLLGAHRRTRHDEPVQPCALQREARRLHPRGGTGDAGEAPGEQSVQQAPSADARPLVRVAVGEPPDGQGDGTLLEHGGATRGVRRARKCEKASPADAARLDRDDEPVVAAGSRRAGAAVAASWAARERRSQSVNSSASRASGVSLATTSWARFSRMTGEPSV